MPFPVVKEILIDPVIIGLLIPDGTDRAGIETIEIRIGIREQDRRMGGDDKLDVSGRAHFPQQIQ